MANRRTTDGLIALLRAQRREVDRRAPLERESPEWQAANARLDELNREIMHLAEFDASRHEGVGRGVELDLESHPEEDIAFRRRVVECVRKALVLSSHERLAKRTTALLDKATDRIAVTQRLIASAEVTLRRDYPGATLDGDSGAPSAAESPTLLTIRAEREGRVA
jgi:hypothetical protein